MFFLSLLCGGLLLGAFGAQAQHFYVAVHPTETVVVRGAAPSPRHVWIGSEWAWSGGRYVETPGHWMLPPDGRRYWVAGHWSHEHRGDYWIPGHWR
jgi:hypothetical protein